MSVCVSLLVLYHLKETTLLGKGREISNWGHTSREVVEGKIKFVPQTPGYVPVPNSAPDSSTPSHLNFPVATAVADVVVAVVLVDTAVVLEDEVVAVVVLVVRVVGAVPGIH